MQDASSNVTFPDGTLVMGLPLLITIRQAEATGAASGRQLRRMCERGELKAAKVGTDWRIARDPFLRRFALTD